MQTTETLTKHQEQTIVNDSSSLRSQAKLKIALVGGSNSAMRSGYSKYLQEYLREQTDKNIELSYFAVGGVTNLFGSIQGYRYQIAKNHDIIFFEYCINDRKAIGDQKSTPRMAGMALEGFIRHAQSLNPNCIIIILIFGTNQSKYYNNGCHVSATYEYVARRYDIPVINITEILLKQQDINFIKKLYDDEDHAHYARPKGTKIVAKFISQQIYQRNLLNSLPTSKKKYRMYNGNLQNLKFYSNFDVQINQNALEKSIFKNSLFEEEIYTLNRNSYLRFNFKGRLLGIVLKSDWYDGLFKIKLGDHELVTSSFSKHLKNKEAHNINLLSLPFKKSMACRDFKELSISICKENIKNYELDYAKTKPMVSPEQWKLSIIGIAYTGEIKPITSNIT
ncbi:MAG: SGNH/GDSL hydrolase family protein [Cyanobacteria bacterium P01_A01_bin.83]